MTDEQATHEAERSAPADTSSAVSEIETLKRERDENYDRLLRKTAEFENYRKRVERERREQADRAVVDLLQELLLVVDDFDRALAVPGVRLHLYEKHRPRKARKMGHLSAVGATADEAVAAVLRAQELL